VSNQAHISDPSSASKIFFQFRFKRQEVQQPEPRSAAAGPRNRITAAVEKLALVFR
jgi:hypothetical protein